MIYLRKRGCSRTGLGIGFVESPSNSWTTAVIQSGEHQTKAQVHQAHPVEATLIVFIWFFGGFYARWVGRKDRQGNKRNLKDEKVNKIKIGMCSSLVCSQFYGLLNLYVLITKTDFRNICKDKPRGVFQIVAKQSFQQNKIICSNRTAP